MNKETRESLEACKLPAEITIAALEGAVEDIKAGEAMTQFNRPTRRAYIKMYESRIKRLKRGLHD